MSALSPLNILKLIDQESIMQRYFPEAVIIGHKYRNPFRSDSNAGCYFAYTKKGTLNFFDHAQPDYGGDCFKVIMLAKGLNFKQALDKVNEDFNLNLAVKYPSLTPYREDYIETLRAKEKLEKSTQLAKLTKGKTHYKIQARHWERADYNYWYGKYGISFNLLHKYNILPVHSYSARYPDTVSFKPIYDYNVDKDPCYCYRFIENNETTVKLYRPLTTNQKYKWKSNVSNVIQGYENLPDEGEIVIITSSMKDALVLIANGYNAIAPQSENVRIKKEVVEDLKKRFKRVFVCFDNDATGKTANLKVSSEYNCEVLDISTFPINIKDVADIMHYCILNNSTMTEARQQFKTYINSLIEHDRSTTETA